VPVRYFDEASSINFRRSFTYGVNTLSVVGQYWLDRLGIRRSPLFQPKADSPRRTLGNQEVVLFQVTAR